MRGLRAPRNLCRSLISRELLPWEITGSQITVSPLDQQPLPWILCQHRGPKKQANELRTGNVIQSSDARHCSVTKFEYAQGSGRQLGNVHLELRDVRTGRKTLERLRPYDMMEVVRVDSTPFQYLFQEGDLLTLMHPETYDQITVNPSIFGSQRSLLKEGGDVILNLLDGEPISGELPPTITLRVAEAEPFVKGDSATDSLKGATLETGASVSVPSYVQVDDLIIINTQDLSFVKRAS